jgi:hypothetical protein
MVKKIGDKSKVKEVKSTTTAHEVEGAQAITGIEKVKATTGVEGVKGVGGVSKRRPTRTMTLAERQELMRMIGEEAEKMFKAGELPRGKQEVVTKAVQIAVDSGLIDDSAGDDQEEEEN